MNKEYDIGGICAYNESGSIAESYVSGAIKIIINSDSSSYSNYIGGIVAEMPLSSVKNVFNLCEISVDATSSSNSNYIGGITGKMGSLGTYLYNAGNIMCTEKENNSKCYIGNIAGTVTSSANFNSTCYSFYYLKSLSNYTAIGNRTDSYYSDVVGLTIGQMKSQSAFNFDFDNVWIIDPASEYPYPTLQEVPYVSSGSSPQPTTEPEQNETNPSSDSSLKGDINGDGKVNATDAAIILVYAAMTGAGHQVSIDDLY